MYYIKSHVFGDYFSINNTMSYKKEEILYFESEDEAYNTVLDRKLSYIAVMKKN